MTEEPLITITLARCWTIQRFKGKTNRGRVYPIRRSWSGYVHREFVLSHCQAMQKAGDKDFKGFKHFDCHPAA